MILLINKKNYYQVNDRKYKLRSREYYRNISQEKISKYIMLTTKRKICQMRTDKEESNIWKIIIIKKNLLHYLIDCVEGLETACISS